MSSLFVGRFKAGPGVLVLRDVQLHARTDCYLDIRQNDRLISMLPAVLLSSALHLKWEHGHAGSEQGIQLLAHRVPGFNPAQYAEAGRLAAVLNGAAYELAAAWFASRGQSPMPTPDELECLCPGFLAADYAAAIEKHILWARK